MNKRFFLLLLSCILTYICPAQSWQLGIDAGISSQRSQLKTSYTDAVVGIMAARSLTDKFSLQFGGRYIHSEGVLSITPEDRANYSYWIKPNLVQVPLRLNYVLTGNKLKWKIGGGVAPEIVWSADEYFVKPGFLTNSIHNNLFMPNLMATFAPAQFEYRLSNKLAIGLGYEFQVCVLRSPRILHNYTRQLCLFSTSYLF